MDAIADAVEDDEAASPTFDPFGHKLVRRTMADYLERICQARTDVARLKGEMEAFEKSNPPDDTDEEELEGWNYSKDLERQIRELKIEHRDELKKLAKREKAAAKLRATESDTRAASEVRVFLQPVLDRFTELEAALAPYDQIRKDLAEARARYRELTNAFVDELRNRCAALNEDAKPVLVLELLAQDVQTSLAGAVSERRRTLLQVAEGLWDKYRVTLTELRSKRVEVESQMNRFPEGLEVSMSEENLSALCAINPRLGASTPPDFEFRYLDISAVTKGRIDWSATQIFRFAECPSRARRRLRKGDALLCTVRPGLQAHARIEVEGSHPVVGSTGFAAIRPQLETDSSFLFHQLFSDFVTAQLRARETGSNYPAVNEGDVRHLRLYTPERDERQRIAVVLDTVDEVIANWEAVAVKLRHVRAGLLHDLLTRGLDENGLLRDPITHPDQFQESSLGRIPKSWEVITIGEYFDLQTGATPSRQQEKRFFSNGSVAWIKTLDLNEGWITSTDERITQDALIETSCRLLPERTVLVAMYGGWEQIGRTAITATPAATNQAICALVKRSSQSRSGVLVTSAPIPSEQVEASSREHTKRP